MTAQDHPSEATPEKRSRVVRLEPLGENVILVDWEADEKSASADQGNICRGTVFGTGAKVPFHARVPDGDRVVWLRHSGQVVEHAGVRYLVLDYRSVLAVWREIPGMGEVSTEALS